MNLAEWLAYQERLHPQTIALGLERVSEIATRMKWNKPAPFSVITVAGTNGKGSCVAFLAAILRFAGYRTGAYTSPHLLRYNERIKINGQEISDEELCAAFTRIENVRGTIPLTYFEYGTLAALDLFHHAELDWIILEVGLGGRLDATNIIDPDLSLVTTVDLDHLDWLGPDREAIGREKAGIFRCGRPALYGDLHPPQSVIRYAQEIGAPFYLYERDFGGRIIDSNRWDWWGNNTVFHDLPTPKMQGSYQYRNAAIAIMALSCLQDRITIPSAEISSALITVTLPGRFQLSAGEIPVIFDVAHNPQAALALAANLDLFYPAPRTHAVVAMLADKDISGVLGALHNRITSWYCTTLPVMRAAPAVRLTAVLDNLNDSAPRVIYPDVASAFAAARAAISPGDRIVVFGSFHTVAAAIRYHERTISPG